MVKCTSDVNMDKLFSGVGGEGGGNVVLNEWYLMFQSGMALSRNLEHNATGGRGGSLWLKAWVFRRGYWPFISSRIALAKAAFYKNKTLYTSNLGLNLSKKLAKCCVWITALCGAESWALRKLGQKFDIFVNCNWVVTRWQYYSTHLHTNNTQNNTKRTIHRTTQKCN
jgi:hypothetical protein